MNRSPEELLGELSVTTKLMLGSEYIRILVTDRRLIVDHVGKRGWGSVAGKGILGRLSDAFEDLFKSGKESVRRRRVASMGPDEILRAHKDNFAVRFDEVVSVNVEQAYPLNMIVILTRDDKFEFLTRTRFDTAVDLFSKVLQSKLTIRKLPKEELEKFSSRNSRQ